MNEVLIFHSRSIDSLPPTSSSYQPILNFVLHKLKPKAAIALRPFTSDIIVILKSDLSERSSTRRPTNEWGIQI